ncbi:hypothetical protein GCM10011512_28470 [Tersicoccus solisilvae]|uniref:VanZ-like domain-containing protein n=1 Tax=Tersicoccus solisilvae TaxID=1882339 RepID=A0ABQ1PMY6_9MICC|nr:hypothetical protein GCM10011512_28470 [Tersicoccus solisilvae]
MAAVLAIGYAVLVLVLTLRPGRTDPGVDDTLQVIAARLRDAGLAWADYAAVEWAANVVLFVPAGLLLALLLPGRARWWAVVLGTAASVAIETAQAVFLPGRVASVADVAANTLGTTIGVAIAAFAVGLLARRRSALDPVG